ncbi:uncharacterized protein [Spinacia oleracea]|uniref:Uncharacterized protein n=1 Tax=Spinacia oleracea TaxID=3562 RepID=A0A9R0I5B1_SPIOL|nr:uncharacterized protein LOC110782927 [Spinacia oleracea]
MGLMYNILACSALFLWKSFMKRSSHVSNIEFSHIAKPQLTELRLERPENLIEKVLLPKNGICFFLHSKQKAKTRKYEGGSQGGIHHSLQGFKTLMWTSGKLVIPHVKYLLSRIEKRQSKLE